MGDALTSDAVFGLRCLTSDLQTESVMEAAIGRKNQGNILSSQLLENGVGLKMAIFTKPLSICY